MKEKMKKRISYFHLGSRRDRWLLYKMKQIAAELGLILEIHEVQDIETILHQGLPGIPALLMEDQLLVFGDDTGTAELRDWLEHA